MYFSRSLIVLMLSMTMAKAAPPQVVADIPPVQSLVAQVMGNLAAPALLTDATSDPHHMQLRPSQARLLAGADVLFWVGPGLMPWLDGTTQKLNADITSVPLIELPGTHQLPDDPHAWLDPENGIVWLGEIANQLSRIDPENATTYQQNAEAAKLEIAAHITEIQADLNARGTVRVLMAHDAMAYFANRFGVTVAGSLSDSDDQPPGAAKLRELQAMLRSNPVDCALIEPQQDSRILETLLADSKTPIFMFDPIAKAQPSGPALYGELLGSLAQTLGDCK